MDTIIATINDKTSPDDRQRIINKAGEILRNGGIVAFPTETVYGLGANALDEEAAAKIYSAKGRPSDNPLIIHISKLKDIEVVASEIPDIAMKLADEFWPGPMTMILNKTPLVPLATTGGLETVAIRMPSSELSRQIIEAGGGFIAAPSANSSGKPSPTSASHVICDLDGRIDMIVDGGSCSIGLESTIVDLTVNPPVILRPGFITAAQLEECIGYLGNNDDSDNPEASPKAPGMKYRHYAPKAELSLFAGRVHSVADKINSMTLECISNGKSVGIICSEETKDMYEHGFIRVIGSLSSPEDIAAHLYEILRSFDERGVDYIFSESFYVEGIGEAIMNRLNKAAGGKVFICSVNIDYSSINSLIFVDDNDTCMAPMASAIFSRLEGAEGISTDCRGLNVLFEEPMNPKAEIILNKRGISLRNHRAVRLKQEDFNSKNTVVVFTSKMKNRIMERFDDIENLYTLSELIDDMTNLTDPFGGDIDTYELCYNELSEALNRLRDLIVR